MIRFVVQTISRKRDTNGNTYHRACIYSTVTGACLVVEDVGGDRGGQRAIYKCLDMAPGERVMNVEGPTLPARQYDAGAAKSPFYPQELTADHLLELERG